MSRDLRAELLMSRDLRAELFVEAYKTTGLRPIRGRWMGYGRDTREACGLSCLAIKERPDLELEIRGFGGTEWLRETVAGALGITEQDAVHFASAWDYGSVDRSECSGCDVCRAALAAREAVEKEVGKVARPTSPTGPTVRPAL